MQNNPITRHCEPQAKQPRPKSGRVAAFPGVPRRLRLRAMTAAGASALLPSLALAHPGHGAPVVHSHEWEIGLALVAAIVGIGFAVRAYRSRK